MIACIGIEKLPGEKDRTVYWRCQLSEEADMTRNNEGKRIAVTGANGFIGANCTFALLEAGFDVVAVVRDPTNERKVNFLKEKASRLSKSDHLEFAAGDLLQDGSYDDAFEGCYGVLHTATNLELGNSVGDNSYKYEHIVKPAVDGTRNVVASVKKHSKTIKRFVNISSVAAIQTMDAPLDHVFVDTDWNTYATVENGYSYGYAKTEAEKVIWDDAELKSKVAVIVSLNPSVVLGPAYCKHHAEHGSSSMIRNILLGTPLLNFNMTFVDVRDVAKGVILALTKPQDDNDEAINTINGKRFILNATEPQDSVQYLNESVRKSVPNAKGATPLFNDQLTNTVFWLGRNVPALRKLLRYFGYPDEYIKNLVRFDNTLSKEVLGIGSYRTMEDTCKVSAESMKPFL